MGKYEINKIVMVQVCYLQLENFIFAKQKGRTFISEQDSVAKDYSPLAAKWY